MQLTSQLHTTLPLLVSTHVTASLMVMRRPIWRTRVLAGALLRGVVRRRCMSLWARNGRPAPSLAGQSGADPAGKGSLLHSLANRVMWSLETIFSPTAQQRGARAATSEADAAKQADSLADFPEFELLVAAPEPLTQQLDPVVEQQQDPVIAQRDSEIEELRAQLQPLEELRAQSQELRAEREKMVAELATLREEMRISSEVQQAQANAMRQQLKAEYAAMEDELTSQLKEEVEKLLAQEGTDVLQQDAAGNHALGAAACGGDLAVVELLLAQEGIDKALDLKNGMGLTPVRAKLAEL